MKLRRLSRNLIGVIALVLAILTIYITIDLNILPNKYLFILIGLELLILIIPFILVNLKKHHYKKLKILGIIIFILSIIGNSIASYYLHNTNRFINNGFTGTYTINTKYYVVASSNDKTESTKSFTKDTTIYYYKYSRSIDKAKETLGEYNYKDTDNVSGSLWQIRKTNSEYLLIAEGNYEYLFESSNLLHKEDFKIIKEFTVSEIVQRNDKIKDVYNIYIAGLDFTGIMRDFNMLVTVNTKTHQVVLTSIPRDYYIDVPAYNMKDTLMALGSLDSEVSKESLEKLFDIEIDYTVNLNTNNLVDVVDKLGGIEFCSDYDFITDHALVKGTYDDTKGEKLHVTKGCKTYSGIEILAIARERMALPGRDRARQVNCRKIAISIGKKVASISTLKNYNSVLNSFDGLYETDMNKKVITNLFKSVLDGNKYEIIEQSVDGTDSIGIGHLGTQDTWTMKPDMKTVKTASEKIKQIQSTK